MSDQPPPGGDAPAPDGLALPPPPAQRRGGIVRRSFALARAEWAHAGVPAFLIALPVALVAAFLDRHLLDVVVELEVEIGAAMDSDGNVVEFLQGFVFAPWAVAAALLVVLGRAGRPGEAVSAGGRRLPQAIGAMVLSGIVSALPMLPAVIVFFAGAGNEVMADVAADGQVVFLGEPPATLTAAFALFLLGLAPMAFLALSLGLAVPLAIADRAGPIAACRDSWRRMRGQRLRLLGGMLATVLPAMFVLSLLALPFGLLALAVGSAAGWVLQGLLDAVLVGALTVLVVSVYAVVRADTAPAEPLAPGDPEARWEGPPGASGNV